MMFSLYELQDGGSPLWSESQSVELDDQGHYTAFLGATQSDGLPLDLFASGKALWLGAQPQLPGAIELPRVLLVAVPYALKAADAETLGGKPASAYVTVDSQSASEAGEPGGTNAGKRIIRPVHGVASTTASTTASPSASTAGITSLNSLSASKQLFSTGTAGTNFNIVSSGSTHTYNLPDASPTARGVVTTGAQTFAGAKTFSTPIAPSSGGSGANNVATSGTYLRGNGTSFVTSSVAAGGAGSCAANQFVTAANDNSAPTCAQPSFGNLSGTATSSQLPGASAAAQGALQLSRDLAGTSAAPLVAGLQGYPVSNVVPAVNQVLQWNGAAWAPSAGWSFAAGGDLSGSSSIQTVVGTHLVAPLPFAQGGLGMNAATSGGIPYFSSGTSVASSGALTANALVKGGGPGAAPLSSLAIDDGSTLSYSGAGGFKLTGGLTGNTANFTGTMTTAGAVLPALGVATSGNPANSNPLDFVASSFNGSEAANQLFRWQAEGNGSSNTGSLSLLYASGSGTPAETGLSINNQGLITFAPGQTFPGGGGTGSVTSVMTGAGLQGGPITSSGTISIANAGVTNAMLANPALTVAAGSGLTGGGPVMLGASTSLGIATGGVANTMLQNPFVTVSPGAGLTGGGVVPLGGSLTLGVDTTKVPQLSANNTFTGSITASSFNGNGAGLTNITAATATNALNLGGQPPSAFQPAGSYATTGPNTFSGTQNMAGNLSVVGTNPAVVPATINAPSGQTADLLDAYVNGSTKFQVGPTGAATFGGNIYGSSFYAPSGGSPVYGISSGSGAIAGITTVGVADTTSTSGVAAGATTVRAGDATGATGANTGGNLAIRPGMVSSTSGTPGTLSISNIYMQGATVTAGNLECFSGTNTVTDCGANASNFVGVAIAKHGTASVDVQQLGVATVSLANGATTGTTAGHFACTGSTTGQVVDSSVSCPAGQTVGIVTNTQASASSPATVNVEIWHAEAGGAAGGGFTAGGDLGGSSTNQTVVGLQGRSVASAAPSSGQVLAWSGSAWAPATPASGGGAGTGTSGALPKWTSATTLGNSPLTDSGSSLTSAETIVAPSLSTNGSGAGVVQLSSGTTSVSWTLGVGAPTGTCSVGSLFSRTDGGTGSTLYVCEGPTGSWKAK